MPFPKHLVKEWGKEIGWKCQICGRNWRDGWILEGHHKQPSHAGGKDTRDNFILLCLFCHYEAHLLLRVQGIDHPASAYIVKARLDKTGGRWKP